MWIGIILAVTLTRLKSYKAWPSWAPGHNCSPAGVRKEFRLAIKHCVFGQMQGGSCFCPRRRERGLRPLPGGKFLPSTDECGISVFRLHHPGGSAQKIFWDLCLKIFKYQKIEIVVIILVLPDDENISPEETMPWLGQLSTIWTQHQSSGRISYKGTVNPFSWPCDPALHTWTSHVFNESALRQVG